MTTASDSQNDKTCHSENVMAGKKKSAKKSAGKRSAGKKSGKKSGKRSGKSSAKSDKSAAAKEVDIMSVPAMDNLHYIAHDAADALDKRGFGWPLTGGKKKGVKKGGKKKKKK
ncbi:hypothetical protein ACOMHN_047304 [Nucella lapillus]